MLFILKCEKSMLFKQPNCQSVIVTNKKENEKQKGKIN